MPTLQLIRLILISTLFSLLVFSCTSDSAGDAEVDGDPDLDLAEEDADGSGERDADMGEGEVPENMDSDGDLPASDGDMDDEEAESDPDVEEFTEEEIEVEVSVAFLITPSSHAIIVAPEASPSEQKAAEDLKNALESCLGGEFPLLTAAPGDDTPMIIIGQGALAQSFGVDPNPEKLGEQGFVWLTTAPHVVIAGTPEVGTMYGVHRFLGEILGVRWYAPGVSILPEMDELPVPELDRLEKPAFQWRHTSYNWPGKDDEFLAHMGDNNGSHDGQSVYGVEQYHDGRCHSYYRFVSPDEFFDEHPEYFSEIGGVRIRKETQLCLTNPDVLTIVTERMLQRMANDPGAQQHNFSQMDFYNNCQCDNCRAMNELYQSQGGTQFWFINQLAEATSAVYPDKLIGTLAYMYTEEPPVGLEMHPNTAVWLCHMFPSCDSHPISTCPHNADYKRRAEAWSGLVDHLYIWHYYVDFMHYYNPFPNFRALSSDIKFYRDIGVEGIYLQGMGHSGGGGEFSLLRPYYGMNLLWNPDLKPFFLRRDFLRGYYGEAWRPIESYIEMLHDKVEADDVHMHLYINPGAGHLTDEVMDRAHELFNEAKAKVADDEVLLERVKVARMPLVYADSVPRNGYEIKDGRISWLSEIVSMGELIEFFERMGEHGFTTVREIAGDTQTMLLLYTLIKGNPEVFSIENEHLYVEYVPNLGGRALRIVHKSSGECITAWNVKENLYFPFAGGLEDRTGEMAGYYGWVEPAGVSGKTENTVTLSKESMDGFEMERTMTILPGKAVLRVTSTLTNPSDQEAKEGRLRSHMELVLGDVRSTRAKFTSLSGNSFDEDMTRVIAGMREGLHFYDQATPNGKWTFSGSKGLEVEQRFDNSEIDFAWIYAYPESLGEVELELWSKRTMLQPGESISINQDIEIRLAK